MPLARGHMSRDLLSVEPGLPLTEVAKRMVAKDVGAVLVTEGKQLVGILTERDVLRAVARGIDASTTVADWMTRDPETLGPDESTEHAAVLMIHGGFRHLPVLDGDRVVGIVSIRDLMRVTLDDETPRGA
jgi:CBS domain-containing protein